MDWNLIKDDEDGWYANYGMYDDTCAEYGCYSDVKHGYDTRIGH